MFVLRNSYEFLWYSACSSRSCSWRNNKYICTTDWVYSSLFLDHSSVRHFCWMKLLLFSLQKDQTITAATHADEVVGVVFFLTCKVIQICRVLVLQRQRNRGVRGHSYTSDSRFSAWLINTAPGVVACWYLDVLQPPPSFIYFLPEPILLCLRTSASLAPDHTENSKMCVSFFDCG